ncbi:MAG: methylase [Treponema sp.]|nr:methylase [Treponema sp.]
MGWMRTVGSRMKSDYRFSASLVYNTFPWADFSDGERAKIEKTAQAILDARGKYPNATLAQLYNELTMPADLRKAHRENDKAVMAAYGFDMKMTESECVAELFKLYEKLCRSSSL